MIVRLRRLVLTATCGHPGQQRNERQRLDERDQHCRRERDRQRLEELPDDPGEHAEREEDHDGRQRRADDRRHDLPHRKGHRLTGLIAAVEMAVDVLDDHDRVVDDQADGHGEAAHGHDVDRLAQPLHDEEGRHDGERQCDRGDQRQPPVAQEDEQHDDGKHAADQDGIADVDDRGGDELGEIVRLRELEPARQRAREIVQHRFDARADVENVRADLLRNADVGRDLAVAAHERHAVRSAALHRRHVRDTNGRAALDDQGRRGNVLDVFPHARREREMEQAPRRVAPDRQQCVGRLQ
jgi:hypothetical protein